MFNTQGSIDNGLIVDDGLISEARLQQDYLNSQGADNVPGITKVSKPSAKPVGISTNQEPMYNNSQSEYKP